MGTIQKLKRSRLIHLCFAISYFTSGLIINFAQLILFLFLKPFNKRLFRKFNYYLCYSFFCQLVFMADWWSNSKLYVYADDEYMKNYAGKEHVLLIMNHAYEIDWLFGWVFCEKINVLGNCKAYAKKVLSYFPSIGWAWKFAEFVFLERSYDKDKEIINRQLGEIFDYPDPVWLLLNAEGTRFTATKHEASVKFAQERDMTVLKHHLIPRTKGFIASLPVLKKKCHAVLDIQLAISKNSPVPPTLSTILNGDSVEGHLFVRRINMSSVPDDEKEAAEWLQNLYREKDRVQDSFHTHGDFFTSSGIPIKPTRLMKPRLSSLINTVAWIIITLTPMLYYLAVLFLSGRLIYFSIGIGILGLFYILLEKSIGMSKISKGSAYGADGKTK